MKKFNGDWMFQFESTIIFAQNEKADIFWV